MRKKKEGEGKRGKEKQLKGREKVKGLKEEKKKVHFNLDLLLVSRSGFITLL